MGEALLSVGLDVGTTSTQMVLSKLKIENKAGSFSVPEMEISDREIIYKSDVHFTPLKGTDLVDAESLRGIVSAEYDKAGISRGSVDTGAIIITGETSRKENARAVLEQLSDFAGDFVVATAGPDLESVLAAKGAGADKLSESTGKTVLHMDIGGGTSNLALIKDGKIIKTGCLNVGGRLLKFDENRRVTYVSPVLLGLCQIKEGDVISERQVEELARFLVSALEMVSGRRAPDELLKRLITEETITEPMGEAEIISFSGGVADCIMQDVPWTKFGDIGPVLGREIRNSLLCGGEYALGEETIRATVIGAGCHSAQLSGSTVFYRNITFPLKNVPVVEYGTEGYFEENVFVAIEGTDTPNYSEVTRLAEKIIKNSGDGPLYVCLERDMAKALGQALAMRATEERPILCVDRIRVRSESYMDVGAPVGPALPVVIKTLVLSR